ncbi:YqzG/YhdC family protein [Paenisporosarcina sp. FSL H8-0542]|uniref:YqzG/YhdC family protein n=2 Tax=Paenisporosarcina TaxID=651660 RepID=UPI00315A73C0
MNEFKQMTHPIKKELRLIMRKTIIALGIIITANSTPTHIPSIANAQGEIPAYAKWGQLAMSETKSKYPNADIIDYLHEGSESKENTTIEKFKLWLKDGNREFGVYVRIEYNTETEEVVNIKFQETSR